VKREWLDSRTAVVAGAFVALLILSIAVASVVFLRDVVTDGSPAEGFKSAGVSANALAVENNWTSDEAMHAVPDWDALPSEFPRFDDAVLVWQSTIGDRQAEAYGFLVSQDPTDAGIMCLEHYASTPGWELVDSEITGLDGRAWMGSVVNHESRVAVLALAVEAPWGTESEGRDTRVTLIRMDEENVRQYYDAEAASRE
jgi:hypothetical protein